MVRTLNRAAFLLALGLVVAVTAESQAGAIRAGQFNSNTLAANDDGSTGLVSLGFTANFFGTNYSQLYVNNNGNVTFDSQLGTFTPFDLLSTSRVIIAPFFADVDTSSVGEEVTYGTGTVDGRAAFGVNWIDVGHFFEGLPLNSFQLTLIDRSDIAAGDFDIEFNYDEILWESGTASGGNDDGLGGSSARAGFSNGVATAFELDGSAVNGAFLDGGPAATALIHNSLNSTVDGRYLFEVRNGIVEPPPVDAVPEPSTFALLGIGGLALVGYGYRRKRQQAA